MAEDTLSRRGFLKLGGLMALASTDFLIPKFSETSETKESENPNRFGRIETETAYYYPFFEEHTVRPNLPLEMANWKSLPVAHFYELMTDSVKNFLQLDSLDVLNSSGTATAVVFKAAPDFGRVIPDKTLDFFAQKGISVAFEGISLPTSELNFSLYGNFIEGVVVGGVEGAALVLGRLRKKEAKVSRAEFLKTLGGILASVWAFSPSITEILGSGFEALPSEIAGNSIKNALWNINKLTSEMHPEDMVVFFRNIIMARRLQTLGKYYAASIQKKPNISFESGFGHLGISDLLTLGESATLAALNIYPTAVLKNIVDTNGGIEPFCSMLDIQVKDARAGTGGKNIIVDNELKDYLETRLE